MSPTQDRLEEGFARLIARELGCAPRQVVAAGALFADGATIPFVARYRKEATGGLEDHQLETLVARREYFLELQSRRDAVLESIAQQGKLDGALEGAIRAATTKQELEDLYLPFKKKRRTRAEMARERGLAPLADELVAAAASGAQPSSLAARFVDAERGVDDAEGALAGARDILAEKVAETPAHRAALRQRMAREASLESRVARGKKKEGTLYRDYFEHDEPLTRIAAHRLLAILRGEREGVLKVRLGHDDDSEVHRLGESWGTRLDTPCGRQLAEATGDGYHRLLRPSIENDVRAEARARAEAEAITVFRANLESLLLAPPLGELGVIGIDPGYRTGSKVAAVDSTGRLLETAVIHPLPPKAAPEEAARILVGLVRRQRARAVAVGNGTGGRETHAFVRRCLKEQGLTEVTVALVPETGASVYSASAAARAELGELDVALRGAVSIARRLQDPLAELVKIEPRSLGVGQYQHDVDQKALARELDATVEGAVSKVGIELNTASPALLRRVSGIGPKLADSIVDHREKNGAFGTRHALLDVTGLGPKAFEHSAGFLRLAEGQHPLDRTAVHPERYGVVEEMSRVAGVPLPSLIGDPETVARLDLARFRDDASGLGEFTLTDIRDELSQPNRDPRPEFESPDFRDDVTEMADLSPDMVLSGRISNVTAFGAFVDIGVGRDGLVHLSELSHKWVDDPLAVVRVGEHVKVKVLEVDHDRKRISLSIKAATPATEAAGRPSRAKTKPKAKTKMAPPPKATIADLERKFGRKRR